ncbi:MAG: DUF2489 domain-containing protein [Planctomycetes bacterium]|nr:DUF2489 domain-containing protein [Planctomycetota bacterium]MBI3845248.1 DUF2489 domain-containing protein [Planctomycetota bacterium]
MNGHDDPIDLGAAAKRKIAAIANSMIEGRLELLEGCREIVAFRSPSPDEVFDDEDMLTFIGVESELDGVPTGEVRTLCAPEELAEKDQKKDECLRQSHEFIIESCQAVVRRFGGRD